jgi:hypothetical protein
MYYEKLKLWHSQILAGHHALVISLDQLSGGPILSAAAATQSAHRTDGQFHLRQ